jgi:Transglycosylase SLT domain
MGRTTSQAESIGSDGSVYLLPLAPPDLPDTYRRMDIPPHKILIKLASNTGRCTKIRIGARQPPKAVESEGFVLGRGMSNSSQLHTIMVYWRQACAVLPTVALMGAGVALAAPVLPADFMGGVAASSHSPAIVVPDHALTFPAQAGISPENLPVPAPTSATSALEAPGSVLSKGALPASSSLGSLDSTGIPVRALEGYRRAASLVDSADPSCHIDWALLAAIGRVESDHGRFGGSQLDLAGVDQPAVIGVRLDGTNGTARIIDPAGFVLDGDHVYDHAVGPMQFIPSTWRVVGVDVDGTGVKNPQNIDDAATATAIYLCSGPGDLRRPGDLNAAIMRYNASDSYVQMVTAIAATYRIGVSALPAPANSAPPTTVAATLTTKPSKPASAKSAPTRPGSTPTTASGTLPVLAALKAVPSTSAAAAPTTAPPTTAPPTTAPPTTAPPTTAPPTTAPPTTAPPTTAPPTTAAPTTAAPTTTAPTTAPPTG